MLRRPAKAGLGSAYRAGFAIGLDKGYEVLVQMDADLSHDPAVLPKLARRRSRAAPTSSIGSRYVPGGRDPALALVPPGAVPLRQPLRRARARHDRQGRHLGLPRLPGRRRSKAIDYASTRAKGYGFQIETPYRIWQWGGRIVEVPIVFTDRVRGHSKMTWGIFAEELLLVTWWGVRDRFRRLRARRRATA